MRKMDLLLLTLLVVLVHGPAGWAVPDTEYGDADTMTVEELHEQAVAHQRNDPQLSLDLATRALERATRSDQRKIRAQILSAMGSAHYYLGQYRLALLNYQDCQALADEIGDLDIVGNSLNNIGVIYFVWGEHDKALDHYFRVIAIRNEQGDKDGLARAYNNVANVYQTAGDYDQALTYYQQALDLQLELNNTAFVATTHNNIGLLQYDRGEYTVSKSHFETALALEEEVNDKRGMALSLNNLGQVLEAEGQLEAALDQYRGALALREELGDRQGVSVCLHNMGKVYAAQGDFNQAIDHLQRALKMAEEMEVQELIRDDLEGLSEAYELAGDHARALEFHKRYKEAHDKIFNEERSQQMASAEARFEVDLKDQEIQVLRKEKEIEEFRRKILLLLAALSLGILALLLNRYLFQKRAHQQIRKANTALQEAHSHLEKASRDELAHVARVATMGELAAAFAHELNQPLAAIMVNSRAGRNFLDRDEPDPRETLAALSDISSDAERAQEIIRRLRRMMRKGEMRLEPQNINQVVGDSASFLESEFQKQGVVLDLDLDPSIPLVAGDRIQLQQVFLNLLQNALAVTSDAPPGRITVCSGPVGNDRIRLEVRDTGPQVPDDVFSELFEPFFTTKDTGLGMGLPICRTIIEAHGGLISARKNPDRGLTVRVELPAVN